MLALCFLILGTILQAQINACGQSQSFHLVVLGSSTAAGSGPSSRDSTWVNRYRKYLQNINPSNQLTNLARGGYNTYRIQADNYVAPVGRPSVDSSRNITQAISLNPDAIIVNMPSNDAAIGIGVNEQMANFIRLKMVADSFNIPIWICTTQPRNFSVSQRIVQTLTRDSILNYFGSKAIDFWTGLANVTNGIDSLFDSGDGVHLNDTAHGILAQRVINKLIPNVLSNSLPYADFSILNSSFLTMDDCGDQNQIIDVLYGNLGQSSASTQQISIITENLNAQIKDTVFIQSSKILAACEAEQLQANLNMSSAGRYSIKIHLQSQDSIPQNDTLVLPLINIVGRPNTNTNRDTVCANDTTWLIIPKTVQTDQIVWYKDSLQSQLIQVQDSLQVVLSGDSNFYFQMVRGPLHYSNDFETGQTTTTNWNGIMFDIVAQDTIVIDSVNTRFFDQGPQVVNAYYKRGTYSGFENSSNAWNSWGADSISVLNSGDFLDLIFSPLRINQGDTLAIYLHLMNSSSRLSYRASSSSQSLSDGKIEVNSGSGISHTFGSTFFPRNFVGKLYYHYGMNLLGVCASPLTPFQLKTFSSSFDLGPDTTIQLGQNYSISIPNTFGNIHWFNADTSHAIVLDQSNLNLGQNLIWLNAIDANGCYFTDSLVVTLNNYVGLQESDFNDFINLFPNPASASIQIQSDIELKGWKILNVQGRIIKQQWLDDDSTIDVQDLIEGIYWLQIMGENGELYNAKILILR